VFLCFITRWDDPQESISTFLDERNGYISGDLVPRSADHSPLLFVSDDLRGSKFLDSHSLLFLHAKLSFEQEMQLLRTKNWVSCDVPIQTGFSVFVTCIAGFVYFEFTFAWHQVDPHFKLLYFSLKAKLK